MSWEFGVRSLEERCSKCENNKEINEKCIDDMNRDIENMIPGNIKTV